VFQDCPHRAGLGQFQRVRLSAVLCRSVFLQRQITEGGGLEDRAERDLQNCRSERQLQRRQRQREGVRLRLRSTAAVSLM
jgi:hypothetical protein